MAKVSIVVPCYNAQNYIVRCLDSLENQTYKDFDIIIVNDCSTDNTIDIINEWNKDNKLTIKLISNTSNLGPSLSRYYGVVQSNSEWIAFCDSDDWFENCFLETMIDKVEFDNSDIIFCGYQNIIGDYIDRHPLSTEPLLLSPQSALILNADSLCITLVRKSIYLNVPQPNFRNGEDMAIIPLLIQKSKSVSVIPEIMYNYFIRTGSASLTPNDRMIDSLIKSYEHIKAHISNNYFIEMEYIGIRNLVYGCLLNLFKYSFDTKKAEYIITLFEKDFPDWINNTYISKLPLFKRFFVMCAKRRCFFFLYLLSHIHSFFLK